MSGEGVVLEVSGREVRVSNPDKVFFKARAETKLDLVEYYLSVEAPLMRAMGGRPVLLERYPDGASGKSFFQKRVPKGAPDWLGTVVVSTPNGTLSNAMVVADIAHVLWAVNMGCLGFHVWPYLAAAPDFADELRIDLDPQPGVGFDQVREAASEVRGLFEELSMPAFVKTSGRRGLHVRTVGAALGLLSGALRRGGPGAGTGPAALRPDQVRSAAVALARELARRRSDLITDAWWKEERGRRVFVDFNQNAPHKTVFGAWSARPRVGAQVSTPISWHDVDDVEPEELTIATIGARVAETGDPWAAMDDEPASLEPLLEWHDRDMASGLMDAPWPPVYPKMPNEPPRVAPSRARKEGGG